MFSAGYPRWFFIVGATGVLTYLNYRGLEFVGHAVTVICIFTLLPFFVFCCIGATKMDYSRLVETPPGGLASVNWTLLLNTFFWNINYWESAASYSGDVLDPGRNYPLGMLIAVILVTLSLFIPVLVGLGASSMPWDQWSDGSFTKIATEVVGPWMGYWMMAASAVTNIGMFEAERNTSQNFEHEKRVRCTNIWHTDVSHRDYMFSVAFVFSGLAFLFPIMFCCYFICR